MLCETRNILTYCTKASVDDIKNEFHGKSEKCSCVVLCMICTRVIDPKITALRRNLSNPYSRKKSKVKKSNGEDDGRDCVQTQHLLCTCFENRTFQPLEGSKKH